MTGCSEFVVPVTINIIEIIKRITVGRPYCVAFPFFLKNEIIHKIKRIKAIKIKLHQYYSKLPFYTSICKIFIIDYIGTYWILHDLYKFRKLIFLIDL